MAICQIVRMGHPVLRVPADAVKDPTSDEIAELVVDMIDTLEEAGGVGLAAPQIAEPKRVVIYHVPPARMAAERYKDSGLDENTPGIPMTVLINPVIEPLTQHTNTAMEGCLSLPGMAGAVERFSDIRVTFQTLEGKQDVIEAHDFHARVIQHECDHLDGILYPARITDFSTFGYLEEMQTHGA